MPDTVFVTAAQLGGTVFTVIAFLYYLLKRDSMSARVMDEMIVVQKEVAKANLLLARSLQSLEDTVERNLKASNANVNAVTKNTETIGKNTKAVSDSNGKH